MIQPSGGGHHEDAANLTDTVGQISPLSPNLRGNQNR
jgi:hypothetical protein